MNPETLELLKTIEKMEVVDLSKFYWVIGAMFVMNMGTIGTIVWSMLRAAWWLSKLDARVGENSKDVNSAHKKIRNLEERLYKI